MSGSPPVRRIVTGHDAQGRAVIRSDDLLPVEPIPSGDAAFSLVWTTASVPADNNDETDGRLRDAALTLHRGSVLRIVDMLPGGQSPFHRSSSIDYGIVLSGAVELELDEGAVASAQAGDIVVQRGTVHLWRNPSASEVCRIAFVLIEAAPVVVDGVPLSDIEP
ncbi:cupin domain-containing protein [Erythrobacter sp. WG]|uniref:cupin domain-containing protein n=1 Tax=Erythrobacter sp. WG TaxID=2985510 RepID=UPI00226D401E|nr:cupin domain-containing protein [Erythrobacter sp. WG]MCX9146545.1 cupin domain-containing protein [Erythrobacter sp. WG]